MHYITCKNHVKLCKWGKVRQIAIRVRGETQVAFRCGNIAFIVLFPNIPFTLQYLLHYGTMAFRLIYQHVVLNSIHPSGRSVTQQQTSLDNIVTPTLSAHAYICFPIIPPKKLYASILPQIPSLYPCNFLG